MLKTRWYFHPLTIFIFSLVALVTSFYLYLHSYLRVTGAFQKIVEKNNLEASRFLDFETWVIVLILSLLLGVIVVGIVLIYVYYQKMIMLLRQQQNFISGFTHELKTPVASLQLFIDTLAKHDLPRDKEHYYLEVMKKDTERLSDNINQILQLARLEDKKEKREFAQRDIVEFLSDFTKRRAYAFEKLSIKIDDSGFQGSQDEKRFVKLNEGLIDILFMNIFVNCQKYLGKNSGEVIVRFTPKKKKIDIHITDRGVGLTKDQQRKIFKKFYQVTKTGKGSGIGLYIAQLIARAHKGELRAESPGLNRGTTMTVSLPYAHELE